MTPWTREQVALYTVCCVARTKAIKSLLEGDRAALQEWESDFLAAVVRNAELLVKDLTYLATEVRRKLKTHRHLSLVRKAVQPVALTSSQDSVARDDSGRRLGPPKPDRPAAAVRKSLRAALIRSSSMEADVLAVDSRVPTRALPAVKRLQAHAARIAALTTELETAVRREVNGQRWLKGLPPYVE